MNSAAAAAALSSSSFSSYWSSSLGSSCSTSQIPHQQTLALPVTMFSAVLEEKTLATALWTMDELAKIMDCKRTRGQHVIPIFYKVRPTDVLHQKGNYEIAFKRHKKLFKANVSTLQQWMTAMTEAANLSGWEISEAIEAELVEEIANGVIRKLESMSRSPVIVGDIQMANEPQGANFNLLLRITPTTSIPATHTILPLRSPFPINASQIGNFTFSHLSP
ncbi:hypothetical protein K1719_017569 [Acacia pycnantha]|nr:hypothetical protein K1719_017569 [Acacia pycnantha]